MNDQEYAFDLVKRLAAIGIYAEAKPHHGRYIVVIPGHSFDNFEALVDLGEDHWADKYGRKPA